MYQPIEVKSYQEMAFWFYNSQITQNEIRKSSKTTLLIPRTRRPPNGHNAVVSLIKKVFFYPFSIYKDQ